MGKLVIGTCQQCTAWGCENATATAAQPLCPEHWRRWQAWELEECERCHWLYGLADILFNKRSDWALHAGKAFGNPKAFLCLHCIFVVLSKKGELDRLLGGLPAPQARELQGRIAGEVARELPPPPPRRELKRERAASA